jgi:hypothetical protein
MPQLVYALCGLTSILCAALLWRQYRKMGGRLLFWSAGCFICLALSNVVLCVDLILLAGGPDLSMIRSLITLGGVAMLLGALIWESVT